MVSFIDMRNDIIDIFSRLNFFFDVRPKCFILQELLLVESLKSFLLVLIEQKKENQAKYNEDMLQCRTKYKCYLASIFQIALQSSDLKDYIQSI